MHIINDAALMMLNMVFPPFYNLQGSHFFPLTNFPDFSSIFFIFPWLLLNIFMAFIQYFYMH